MRPTVQRELPIDKGDTVRIKGLTSTGTVESLDGKMAMVVFGGGMRTKMRLDRLERAQEPKASASTGSTKTSLANLQTYAPTSNITRSTVDAHVKHFRTEIDLRGMRGDEALMQVQYFIDDAILGRCFPGAHPPRQGQRHPAPNDPPVSCHRAQRPVLPRRTCAVWRSRHHRRGTVIAGAHRK